MPSFQFSAYKFYQTRNVLVLFICLCFFSFSAFVFFFFFVCFGFLLCLFVCLFVFVPKKIRIIVNESRTRSQDSSLIINISVITMKLWHWKSHWKFLWRWKDTETTLKNIYKGNHSYNPGLSHWNILLCCSRTLKSHWNVFKSHWKIFSVTHFFCSQVFQRYSRFSVS